MKRERLKLLLGDEDEKLIDLMMDLWDVMQAWDDAVDGDPHNHAEAYKKAMINLPNNPYYIPCNIPFLVAQAYYNWNTANIFETKKEELEKAYMLRASYYGIIIMVVHTVHGKEEAERIAPYTWRYYDETYKDYHNEMLGKED
ncbi:hypothetical protein AB832_08180 [Flavobacteriaceae bacterium (ex Bugula neritina AB1)]|jgi:hypothetical protein|nr:hypothetical protein AB832_08180 [Flavobacteriaceae bacterium (ex Bugula neritina AB1)]